MERSARIGPVAPGTAFLESALTLATDRPHDVRYARALAASAMLIAQSGEHERARALFLQVMEIGPDALSRHDRKRRG